MRVMVLVKATADSEAGKMPSEQLLSAMMAFNEELVKAGVMQAGEGLHPSVRGKRVRFSRGKAPVVVDGPFAETKELVAGFWLWKVQSMEEAVAWARQIPTTDDDSPEGEVEIRQVFDADDFGPELTPELREKERKLREQTGN